MTSFLARTFGVIAHQHAAICAVLATSREIMNCSAVPVTLSSETWNLLSAYEPETERRLLELFSTFSDTMQFTEKLRIRTCEEKDFVKSILENLIKNKRYFARTIRLLQLPSTDGLIATCCTHPHSSTTTTPIVLSNLRSLSIEGFNTVQSQQLKTICSLCPFLEDLNIPLQYQLTDEGVEFLSHLKHLKVLDLSWCKLITDSGFNHLAKLSSLKSLNLHQCKITNDGLEHLAKLLSLQLLNLGVCQLITDRGLEHLGNVSSLQSLNLNAIINITDTGLKHLLKLPSLQSLNLSYCDNITDNGLQHLAQLSSLQSLSLLWCNKITDEGCSVFSESMKVIR